MIVRQYLRWTKTASEAERAAATSALARAYLHSEMPAEDRREAVGALMTVLDDPCLSVRKALARALADDRRAPIDLVLRLARDTTEVAEIVLSRSPVLNAGELIDIVENGEPGLQWAIALRAGLEAPVTAAIAEAGDAMACLALLENASADVPGLALGRIVARFGAVADVRDALLERRTLPPETRQALLHGKVAGGAQDLAAAEPTAELRAAVRALGADDRLTAGFVLRALLNGHMCLVVEALAVRSGLSTVMVMALAADRSGAAFRSLHARAKLPAASFPAFRAALEVVQGADYVDEASCDPRLRRCIGERVVERYRGERAGTQLGEFLALMRGTDGGTGSAFGELAA